MNSMLLFIYVRIHTYVSVFNGFMHMQMYIAACVLTFTVNNCCVYIACCHLQVYDYTCSLLRECACAEWQSQMPVAQVAAKSACCAI